ncbi:glycosyltransferase family 4 protein [Virgibacillus ndiopensis]|uniref:glycosyltransferase family 4 protein n=1 Tax=Virgibacillus ndiopensis TaxID=2004408 RepID=UPI000C082444|nr:glycosyltransferase family 4 protein [Virgibacillus ndiopensis]
MTKKVLIMTQNFYPVIGSAGNRMKNIFQLLNENKIDTDVLTTEPAYPNKNMYNNNEFWDDETLNEDTTKIIRVPIKKKRFSNQILSRLFFYIEIMCRFLTMVFKMRKNKYDYILVSTPPIFIVFSALVGKRLFKSKLILEVRDLWPDSLSGVRTFDFKLILNLFRYLEKRMYRLADFIIINSKGFETHIKSRLKHKTTPIVYLPNGPRINELVDQKNKTEQEFRVVYAGNIGLAQDINRLKQIASLLNEKEIRFDVLGYGIKTNEFISYLDEKKLYNVYIHEPTTRKKSLNLIKNSDVAIAFLNDDKVFSTVLPGKIIDYMTCKTPIIAGIKGTAAEIIKKNQTGYVFGEHDVNGMVNKIIDLREDPDELNRLSTNCSRIIEDDFLWEKNITTLTEIIT